MIFLTQFLIHYLHVSLNMYGVKLKIHMVNLFIQLLFSFYVWGTYSKAVSN